MINFKRVLSIVAIALIITGCGGGGGENIVTTNTTNTDFSFYSSCDDLTRNSIEDGLKYLNDIRKNMGLTVVELNSKLNEASINHANFLRINDSDSTEFGHDEKEGLENFTGTSPWDRVFYVGYNGYMDEVISFAEDSYIGSLRSLLGAVYHRFALISINYDEIGSGHIAGEEAYVYETGNSKMDELCSRTFEDKNEQKIYGVCSEKKKEIPYDEYLKVNAIIKKENPKVIVYPYANQKDFCPSFYGEVPDPIPNLEKPSGTPISIQFNDAFINNVEFKSFKLYEDNTTEVQNIKILNAQNDPNKYFTKYDFAFFPIEPLKPNKWYKVEASFNVDGEILKKEWSFKTQKGE